MHSSLKGNSGLSAWFWKTHRGRVGGKNSVHVAARTPTPPIAHNASQTTPDNETGTAKRAPSGGRDARPTGSLNEHTPLPAGGRICYSRLLSPALRAFKQAKRAGCCS